MNRCCVSDRVLADLVFELVFLIRDFFFQTNFFSRAHNKRDKSGNSFLRHFKIIPCAVSNASLFKETLE